LSNPCILDAVQKATVAFIMALIKPEDCLMLDIPELDFQHETLIRLINPFHAAMLQSADISVSGGSSRSCFSKQGPALTIKRRCCPGSTSRDS